MLFTRDMMKNNEDIKSIKKPSDRFKGIKEKWKAIGPDQLKMYQQMEQQEKKKVTDQMEEIVSNEESARSELNIDELFNHK